LGAATIVRVPAGQPETFISQGGNMGAQASDDGNSAAPANTAGMDKEKARGLKALKRVFALEYVLQGLANPFQGITYQPFFRHFRTDFGLSEAATQQFFSQSYLAWSFKPLIGFLIDAWGRTRVILLTLLTMAVAGYLLTPMVDLSAQIFFYSMFMLSVVLAATDVAVDRATVVAGEEEAQATGRSRASTVGLNQAICWTAIYGTGILAAISGGWIADNVQFHTLLYGLAVVPLIVLGAVWFLPKDRATPIPLGTSFVNFWEGLNSGPVLWIIVFYFLFHFQPAMGALWTNYLLTDLGFTQTQAGFADGASNLGLFVGVIIFAWLGVRWQDKMGLRKLFKIYILLSIAINLTQYLVVDPWFSRITGGLHTMLPFFAEDTVRLMYLSTYNFLMAAISGLIRMSTFSLVGAVIPVAAAGSLFAGFMSVANLAYSFSYSSGAWLYENGLGFAVMRGVQESVFAIPAVAGTTLSIQMLILIGSLAYLLSFLASHMLPDLKRTVTGHMESNGDIGATEHKGLPANLRKTINWLTLGLGLLAFVWAWRSLGQNPISAALLSFFLLTFLRKLVLDAAYRKGLRA
jgi:MFS family permease